MTDRVLGVTSGITNFAYSSYGYDAVSRLTALAYNLNGAAAASGWNLTYNPAGQIASVTRGNDLLAYQGHANASTASSVNGLNQLTGVGGATVTHDGRGNLTSDETNSYTYDDQNRLVEVEVGYAKDMGKASFRSVTPPACPKGCGASPT